MTETGETLPTVSAVIPAYNAERFLSRAIRSALAQDPLPDEILVVDDGSTDGSAAIARGFGSPVRCIQQANAGASAARNRGIAEARGELVAFLDSDDEWLPHHLGRAVRVLARHPELGWYSDDYRFEPPLPGERPGPGAEAVVDDAYLPDFFAASRRWEAETSAMVIRRAVFGAVGCFDTSLVTAEDRDLWFRIGLRYPAIGYGPEIGVIEHAWAGSLNTQGHFTSREALGLLQRSSERAEALGAEAVARARPLLARWATQGLRLALLEGDREALGWLLARYENEIAGLWRIAAGACRHSPPPLWRALIRVWEAFRWLRLLLMYGSRGGRGSAERVGGGGRA
jgi:hypothetical protein